MISGDKAKSHPTWVCGLKRVILSDIYIFVKSHPTWVCGLKRYWQWKSNIDTVSHPTWVCGLKQRDWQEKMWGMVTPYVGVWIETLELAFNADGFQGHTLRGCVD